MNIVSYLPRATFLLGKGALFSGSYNVLLGLIIRYPRGELRVIMVVNLVIEIIP